MQVLTERRPAVHIGLGKELVHGAADGRDEERLARHQEAVDTILASWLEAAAAEKLLKILYDGRFSAFLRSEKMQYILIGSEYSETSKRYPH